MGKKRKVVVDDFTVVDTLHNVIGHKVRFKAMNEAQKEFAKLITDKEIVFSSGPAGTGKSYVSIARAIELLQNKTNKYNKIVIYKPAIEVEEKHGFLPGDLEDKIGPYVESSLSIIDKLIGKQARLRLMMEDVIEIKALAYIRGSNIDNSILIMEEAQNMSPNQMKTLLTRIGEDSKFIISGDMDQSDRYRNPKQCGLYDAMERLKTLDSLGFFYFDINDIVRNPIITKILGFYKPKEEVVAKPRKLAVVPKEERSQLNEGVAEKPVVEKEKKIRFKKIRSYFKW